MELCTCMQGDRASGSPAGDVLPVGVPVLAQVSLAALSSCDLLLQGVSLVPHAGPGGQQPGVGCSQLPEPPRGTSPCPATSEKAPISDRDDVCRGFTDTQYLCEDALALEEDSLPDCTVHGTVQCWPDRCCPCCCAGVAVRQVSCAASAEAPVLFRKGDVHSVAAQVVREAPGRGVPVGDLAVTWQRSRCVTLGMGQELVSNPGAGIMKYGETASMLAVGRAV